MSDPAGSPRVLRLDLMFYLVSLTFAGASALFSEFYDYRVWGNFATIGYLLALGASIVRRRWVGVGLAGLFAIVVPTVVLIIRRAPDFVWGPWPWSFPSQPEVWVVERSARLLLDNGTPYPDFGALGRPPIPDDYTPYGPVMTVFGLPRAIFGASPVTDARVAFVIISALVIILALRVFGRPTVPVLAAQLAVISPLTALTATVAGDDLPVIAMIVLGTALVYRAGPVPAGIACALVVNMKLTALPALGVLAVAMIAYRGWRALIVFLSTIIATTAVVVLPVLLVDPNAFVEQVIKFPAGLGRARSPAASPLPGHLIASAGPVGHAIAIGLLGLAACVIAAWLVLRPPRNAADAMTRIATALAGAILLAPASRWGYLIYPIAMLGAMIVFRASTTPIDPTAEPHAHGGTPVGPTESAANPDAY
jgi:glycosyl transferase family 87